MPPLGAIDPLVRTMPLWALALLLVAAAILALEAGAWLGRRQMARALLRSHHEPSKSDAEDYIIGSIFGLLAFLIGLTFSMALDRFDERRGWVDEESAAISTAYLRAELLDEPHRSQLRTTLRDYAGLRLTPDGISNAELAHRSEQDREIRDLLWKRTTEAVYPIRETELASYYVEAVNNALNVGTRRELEGRAQVPVQILDILFLYLLISSAVLGSLLGREGNRQRASATLLIVLFTLSIILILDIDRPRSGSIKVSQRGLEALVVKMNADAKVEASRIESAR